MPLVQQVTLVASTVTTVNIGRPVGMVHCEMEAAVAEAYITVDGSAPTVGGAGTTVLSALVGDTVDIPVNQPLQGEGAGTNTVVKLISTGTPVIAISA